MPYGRYPSDPWIGRIVVLFLGIGLATSLTFIGALAIAGHEIPPSLTGLMGVCLGALTSFMYAMMRHQEVYERGRTDERREGNDGP